MRINELGQPIGDALPDFQPGDLPNLERIEGQYVIIERLSKDKHGGICMKCMVRILLRICGPISFKLLPKIRQNGPKS